MARHLFSFVPVSTISSSCPLRSFRVSDWSLEVLVIFHFKQTFLPKLFMVFLFWWLVNFFSFVSFSTICFSCSSLGSFSLPDWNSESLFSFFHVKQTFSTGVFIVFFISMASLFFLSFVSFSTMCFFLSFFGKF